MCFYNAQSKKAMELARRYGRKTNVVEMYEEMMAEKKKLEEERAKEMAIGKFFEPAYYKPNWPIVTDDEQLQVMRWGMIPSNATMQDLQKYEKGNWFVNARSDKIFETYPYRFSITHHRCIIPSTGYFEPHYGSNGKSRLYYVFIDNQEVFSMGGVCTEWTNPINKEIVKSYAIITTDANEFTYHIHNGGSNPHRMPLILSPEDEEQWVNPNIGSDEIKKLMEVFPATNMAAYPLRDDYKYHSFSDASIIENTTDKPPLKLKDFQNQ